MHFVTIISIPVAPPLTLFQVKHTYITRIMMMKRLVSTITIPIAIVSLQCEQAVAFSSSFTISDLSIRRFSIPVLSLRARNPNQSNNERKSIIRPLPFSDSSSPKTNNRFHGRDLSIRSFLDSETASMTEDTEAEADESTKKLLLEQDQESVNVLTAKVSEITGQGFDEDRFAFPELASGEVPRIFSNISYQKSEDVESGNAITQALHAPGSVKGAALLVSGTTIGAGILALPTATAPAGLLPSSGALCIAWVYMTMTGLLIAELAINRIGQTGNPSVGLLELYKDSLSKEQAWLASAGFLGFKYCVMVAFISQGGANLGAIFDGIGLESISAVHGLDQVIFVATLGTFVYFAKPSLVENVNNALVLGVIGTFVGILGIGGASADFPALIAPVNQHPEMVANAFPICFLSMVFHMVVPTVVQQLEADQEKVTKAIIIGTFIPFAMFLAWNAIILGNIINVPGALENGLDPIQMLQNEGIGGERLGQLVTAFSELAVSTTVIGFIYAMTDSLTDLFSLPMTGPKFEKWRPGLFALILVPPLIFSLGNPGIFFDALDYGGAFGVSTIFLLLPTIMVWKQRYGDEQSTVTIPPMVPFGKIPLASVWKAAGTLILEQGADKLGVFDFVKEVWSAQNVV